MSRGKSLAKRLAQAKARVQIRPLSRASLLMAGADPEKVKAGNIIEFQGQKILIV